MTKNGYKSLAKNQHKILMLIMEYGCDSKIVRDALKEYADQVIKDPIFLKIQ